MKLYKIICITTSEAKFCRTRIEITVYQYLKKNGRFTQTKRIELGVSKTEQNEVYNTHTNPFIKGTTSFKTHTRQ